MKPKILVSACLLGVPVRYDGQAKSLESRHLERWRSEGRLVSLCPESAGGLPTPRPPAEIVAIGGPPDAAPRSSTGGAAVLGGEGRVVDVGGVDRTAEFLAGAQRALELARAEGCEFALLTERSPSCGSSWIHSGRHDGAVEPGEGVTTALLRRHGVEVFAPADIETLAERVARASL